MKTLCAIILTTGLLLAGAETDPWMPIVNAGGLLLLVVLAMVGIVRDR